MNVISQLTRHVKSVLSKPFGVCQWGSGSVIGRPRKLEGMAGLTVGDNVVISSHSWIAAIGKYADVEHRPTIVIGDGVAVGRYFCLTAIDRVEIGSDCLFSEHVYISDHFHGMHPHQGPLVGRPLESRGPVTIGSGTFVGYRACVLPGVTLGKHCVVGANSVVTRSFPDFSMVAGAPARLIKRYVVERRRWEPVRSSENHA